MENIKGFCRIILREVLHVLLVPWKIRLTRQEKTLECIYLTKWKRKKITITERLITHKRKCWGSFDAKSVYMQVSSKQGDVNIVEDQHKEEEKLLLVMPCITTNKLSIAWLINKVCTNHLTL